MWQKVYFVDPQSSFSEFLITNFFYFRAAAERQKVSFIKRKNLEDAIQQKQELKNKLEKEIEDIDQKLVELRKTLGDAFESMQLEVQHGKS